MHLNATSTRVGGDSTSQGCVVTFDSSCEGCGSDRVDRTAVTTPNTPSLHAILFCSCNALRCPPLSVDAERASLLSRVEYELRGCAEQHRHYQGRTIYRPYIRLHSISFFLSFSPVWPADLY
ncbi:hypothetical protein BDN70DRAFT_885742 [Pholiota conissans]|uniref:Uncharacterized protein n=1 Tax=Pholiota conissans TaxID=109636 RepID=A0A9P5YQE8_9AGAR|nr:hypothetical protein BDN70DRAFT_885742 [Pholiota conissans]